MSKPRTYGTLSELVALAYRFEKNVVLFEACSSGSWYVYEKEFRDAFFVFFTPPKHFDSVFAKPYIESVAFCQCELWVIIVKVSACAIHTEPLIVIQIFDLLSDKSFFSTPQLSRTRFYTVRYLNYPMLYMRLSGCFMIQRKVHISERLKYHRTMSAKKRWHYRMDDISYWIMQVIWISKSNIDQSLMCLNLLFKTKRNAFWKIIYFAIFTTTNSRKWLHNKIFLLMNTTTRMLGPCQSMLSLHHFREEMSLAYVSCSMKVSTACKL